MSHIIRIYILLHIFTIDVILYEVKLVMSYMFQTTKFASGGKI